MKPLRITWCAPDGRDAGRVGDAVGDVDWAMSVERAYEQWRDGQVFYTLVNGAVALVVGHVAQSGNRYLRTLPDSTLANNLGLLVRREWRSPPPMMRSALMAT